MVRAEGEQRSAYELFARGRSMLAGGHPYQAVMLLSQAKLFTEVAPVTGLVPPSCQDP